MLRTSTYNPAGLGKNNAEELCWQALKLEDCLCNFY